MQNPLLKNRKTGLHDDLAHRTSHYNRLLSVKPSYNTRKSKKRSMMEMKRNRYSPIEQQRKTINRRLLQSIIDIEKNYKSYGKQEYRSPKTLKSAFLMKQQQKKIVNGNKLLFEKITTVNPIVGSKRQWKKCFKRTKILHKLKHNNRSVYSQLDSQFFIAYQKLRSKKKDKNFIKLQQNLTNRQANKSYRIRAQTEGLSDQ